MSMILSRELKNETQIKDRKSTLIGDANNRKRSCFQLLAMLHILLVCRSIPLLK